MNSNKIGRLFLRLKNGKSVGKGLLLISCYSVVYTERKQPSWDVEVGVSYEVECVGTCKARAHVMIMTPVQYGYALSLNGG